MLLLQTVGNLLAHYKAPHLKASVPSHGLSNSNLSFFRINLIFYRQIASNLHALFLFCLLNYQLVGRDSSAGIATRYGLDSLGVETDHPNDRAV